MIHSMVTSCSPIARFKLLGTWIEIRLPSQFSARPHTHRDFRASSQREILHIFSLTTYRLAARVARIDRGQSPRGITELCQTCRVPPRQDIMTWH